MPQRLMFLEVMSEVQRQGELSPDTLLWGHDYRVHKEQGLSLI